MRNMKLKCIALDLDDTLITNNRPISEKTKTILAQAASQGIQIVIASGRAYSSLPKEILSLPGIEYVITSNGACIYRTEDHACIRRKCLDQNMMEGILFYTEKENITFEVFFEGKGYAQEDYVKDPVSFGYAGPNVEYIYKTRRPVPDIRRFMREHDDAVEEVAVVVRNQEQKDRLWRQLKEKVPGIYLTSSISHLLEIANEQAGKHRALADLCETLGISKEETAAFGNAENDREMIAWSRYGIAVGNACQSCKDAAWKVADVCERDGVAKAIEVFFLNNR